MAVFAPKRGLRSDLPSAVSDGALFLCIDTGEVFLDYTDASGKAQRMPLNATETWTFTLSDGSTVKKQVVLR